MARHAVKREQDGFKNDRHPSRGIWPAALDMSGRTPRHLADLMSGPGAPAMLSLQLVPVLRETPQLLLVRQPGTAEELVQLLRSAAAAAQPPCTPILHFLAFDECQTYE